MCSPTTTDPTVKLKQDLWVILNKLARMPRNRVWRMEPEEVAAEAALYALERLDRFDPERGSLATWCHWQLRAVWKVLTRRQARELQMECEIEDGASYMLVAGSAEASAELAQLWAHATPRQRQAIEATALGLSGPEAEARFDTNARALRRARAALRAAA